MMTAALRGLAIAQFGAARAMRRYQAARLRALVAHAYRTVPFYRRRFDAAGIHPDQIRRLEDLQRIPLTLKSDLRDASEEDVVSSACDRSSLVRYGTGGTTGQPMTVRMTRTEDYLQRLTRLWAMFGLGLRPTDRRAAVIFTHHAPHQSILERFGVMRYRAIHLFKPPNEVIAELRDERPHVIRGYASVLSDIATRLTDEDRRLIRPRFITTDSECLTPLARTRIETGFGAPVFDVYDCFECNVIARQCASSGLYHVMDHAVIVEVLVDGRPAEVGEAGDVAITVLHSRAAPLIRYLPGDVAVRGPETCSCGAPFSCLTEIQGRAYDRLQLPDGRAIHPKILGAWIYPLCPALERYQLVQETRERVVVKLQPGARSTLEPGMVETMRRGITRDLGPGVTVEVSVVTSIPSEPNGKFLTYASRL